MSTYSFSSRRNLREKTSRHLANFTFLLAGYGLGNIIANLTKVIV